MTCTSMCIHTHIHMHSSVKTVLNQGLILFKQDWRAENQTEKIGIKSTVQQHFLYTALVWYNSRSQACIPSFLLGPSFIKWMEQTNSNSSSYSMSYSPRWTRCRPMSYLLDASQTTHRSLNYKVFLWHFLPLWSLNASQRSTNLSSQKSCELKERYYPHFKE